MKTICVCVIIDYNISQAFSPANDPVTRYAEYDMHHRRLFLSILRQ